MIEKLLQLLLAILGWLEDLKRKEKTKQKQADYDAIEENAGDWFNEHFNGVRDTSDVPNNADKASKAHSASGTDKRRLED